MGIYISDYILGLLFLVNIWYIIVWLSSFPFNFFGEKNLGISSLVLARQLELNKDILS